MAIFNSYVKLPEGIPSLTWIDLGIVTSAVWCRGISVALGYEVGMSLTG